MCVIDSYYNMTSRTKNHKHVKLSTKIVVWWIFWLSLVLVGLSLSQWQWQRAAEKRSLLTQWSAEEIIINPNYKPNNLSRVRLTGHYLHQDTLWLDNRIYRGQIGVAALTPLVTATGEWWLIQRGFVPTSVDRSIEPSVETPLEEVTLIGYWQALNREAFKLGDNQVGNRLQTIELLPWKPIEYTAFEGVIHQIEGEGLQQPWWEPTSMPPERHQAYAVQWFLLASLALIMALLGKRILLSH